MAFRGGGRGARLLELLNTQGSSEAPGNEPPQESSASSHQKPSESLSFPSRPIGRGGRGMIILQTLDPNSSQSSPLDLEALTVRPSMRQPQGQTLQERMARLAMGTMEPSRPPPTVQKKEEAVRTVTNVSSNPVIRHGTSGTRIRSTCNYLDLNIKPGLGVFEYEVIFNPMVDYVRFRRSILSQFESKIGRAKTFDGVILYLPHKLDPRVTLMAEHPGDGSPVEVTILYKRNCEMKNAIHLYNVLFKRIMSALELTRFGRHYFSSQTKEAIPSRDIEVWPGYITAIDEYEGGIKLCLDSSHRILRSCTVLQQINDVIVKNPGDYQRVVTNMIVGQTVLTRYNNKTYRIDEINWSMNPMSKFSCRDDQEVSFLSYYNKQYNMEIRDRKQPLLVSRVKRLIGEKEVETEICLVPELSYLTGLTDSLRSDFRVMKDIASYTRIAPSVRHKRMMKFVRSVNESPKAKALLDDWGLSLKEETAAVDARVLDAETIMVEGGSVQNRNADFGMEICKRRMLGPIPLENWVVIFTTRDRDKANEFVRNSKTLGPPMGIQVQEPRHCSLPNDRNETFVNALRENGKNGTQVVVIIFPTMRDDRYSAVKKVACCELGVPSQCINAKTLNNPNKVRSIIQKILLQITCKLGGSLWSVNIPMKNIMICGTDVYHDPIRKGKSVGAFISSLNKPCTRWYCQANFMDSGQELVNQFVLCMVNALKKYHEINGEFPVKIIIYRDGIGDGMLETARELEVRQFQDCFERLSSGFRPQLLVLVVQKRINTRFYSFQGNDLANPPPGTVVDNSVTRRNWPDFFLVSQSVREGTVSPTHYIILHDSTEMQIDHIQKLTYKLCFMYYNWPGGIRVPAPCQYAHKLAYLTGQHTRSPHHGNLSKKLFFL